MSGIFSDVQGELPKAANQYLVNLAALYAYQKLISQYVTTPQDSEIMLLMKSAGVITAIEAAKDMLAKRGINLDLIR